MYYADLIVMWQFVIDWKFYLIYVPFSVSNENIQIQIFSILLWISNNPL